MCARMSYSRTAVTLTSVRVSLASLAILYILAVSPRVLLLGPIANLVHNFLPGSTNLNLIVPGLTAEVVSNLSIQLMCSNIFSPIMYSKNIFSSIQIFFKVFKYFYCFARWWRTRCCWWVCGGGGWRARCPGCCSTSC